MQRRAVIVRLFCPEGRKNSNMNVPTVKLNTLNEGDTFRFRYSTGDELYRVVRKEEGQIFVASVDALIQDSLFCHPKTDVFKN